MNHIVITTQVFHNHEKKAGHSKSGVTTTFWVDHWVFEGVR